MKLLLSSLLIQIIFEAVVGDGFLGDIAIDEVKLSTTSCDTSPSYATGKKMQMQTQILEILKHKEMRSPVGISVLNFEEQNIEC